VHDKSLLQLSQSWKGILDIPVGGDVVVGDREKLRSGVMDELVRVAVFAEGEDRERALKIIHECALQTGCYPASIQPLYDAMGRGDVSGLTTPAINVRGMAYDTARAVVRTLVKHDVGACIFELARSEMGYAHQSAGEYASVVLAAAVREGFEGPVFIQGDHYQVNAKKYAAGGESRATEIGAIRSLIADAIAAGYRNIDIDASTIVDLSKSTVLEQQRENFTVSADLTAHARALEPEGTTISIGGEIGEVGGKNSTPEELRAYMDGYLQELKLRSGGGEPMRGPSKISIQTGTTHGGIPLPDGSVAKVSIDFEVLRECSRISRSEYGMAGAVQHGASTLPLEAFDRFPEAGAAEVHLATDFQNIVLDHPSFPASLRAEMYAWCDRECAGERKQDQTPEQFHYKTRKKTWGPFKRQVWDLSDAVRRELRSALEAKFEMVFLKLGVNGTRETVRRLVQPLETARRV